MMVSACFAATDVDEFVERGLKVVADIAEIRLASDMKQAAEGEIEW